MRQCALAVWWRLIAFRCRWRLGPALHPPQSGPHERGITLVFIEHVMRFLTALADRAVIMRHGSLIYDGPPAGIAPDAQMTEVYLGKSAAAMRKAGQ
jgi:ABC-type phosphate/phosphonate transport system ATPase subunit